MLTAMTALPKKVALRRLLQNYMGHLEETIAELMATEMRPTISEDCVADSLQFCEDGIIAYGDQMYVFAPNSYALLRQFCGAPNWTLSKEDIRQDVLCDDDAREGNLRQCILKARKELGRSRFPFRIETIVRKGYRLVAER